MQLVLGILIEGEPDANRAPEGDVTLSRDERTRLLAIAPSRSLPAALTSRAKIVLAGLCGEPATEKAHRGAVWLGKTIGGPPARLR